MLARRRVGTPKSSEEIGLPPEVSDEMADDSALPVAFEDGSRAELSGFTVGMFRALRNLWKKWLALPCFSRRCAP